MTVYTYQFIQQNRLDHEIGLSRHFCFQRPWMRIKHLNTRENYLNAYDEGSNNWLSSLINHNNASYFLEIVYTKTRGQTPSPRKKKTAAAFCARTGSTEDPWPFLRPPNEAGPLLATPYLPTINKRSPHNQRKRRLSVPQFNRRNYNFRPLIGVGVRATAGHGLSPRERHELKNWCRTHTQTHKHALLRSSYGTLLHISSYFVFLQLLPSPTPSPARSPKG